MSGQRLDWIDWPKDQRAAINNALREASDAFNDAYFGSARATTLKANVERTITALNRVLASLSGVGDGRDER